jgi:hypothetical protein
LAVFGGPAANGLLDGVDGGDPLDDLQCRGRGRGLVDLNEFPARVCQTKRQPDAAGRSAFGQLSASRNKVLPGSRCSFAGS